MLVAAGVLGWAVVVAGLVVVLVGRRGGGTRLSPSESRAKLESRAKRTWDLERKNGVGGVLGGFLGEVFAVEGAVVVVPVDEGWKF